MKTTATKKSDTSTKQGRYQSVDDAVRQKQAALLQVLAGDNLTRFNSNGDQSTDGEASDIEQDISLEEHDPVLAERLNNLPSQIEQGEYLTNEAMKEQAKQWLAK